MMRRRKISNKTKVNFITLFLVCDLLLVLTIFKPSNAVFTTNAASQVDVDVALYALSNSSLTIDLGKSELNGLENIVPGSSSEYLFSVSNTDTEGNVTNTDLTYELELVATTNLNLDYKLCISKVSTFDCNEDNNIITVEKVQDEYGTWFKYLKMDIDKVEDYYDTWDYFTHDSKETYYYKLVVTFPASYDSYVYQNISDSIKVGIYSKQVLLGD